MKGRILVPAQDAAQAQWVESSIQGPIGTVGGCVPNCFDAYARIFHPPKSESDRDIKWSDVARATGRRPHPLMQWEAIAKTSDGNLLGDLIGWVEPPKRGFLTPRILEIVGRTLAQHTSEVDLCMWGYWKGNVYFGASSRPKSVRHDVRNNASADPFSAVERMVGASFSVFGQEGFLLQGSLSAIPDGAQNANSLLQVTSPALLWPLDRAWFLATDADFDSTIVGGSSDLVDALQRSPTLEVWPICISASLRFDSDKING